MQTPLEVMEKLMSKEMAQKITKILMILISKEHIRDVLLISGSQNDPIL